MPGTITDDIEIIDAGHGGGTDVPAGGDDDGEGSGGSFRDAAARLLHRHSAGACRHHHVLHGA